jgi:hypothetical protein
MLCWKSRLQGDSMITLQQYIGPWAKSKDWTGLTSENAKDLLAKVNALLDDYAKDGGIVPINPKTKSEISGETGGGFRPQDYPIGASKSTHKTGQGVDIYDRSDKLKYWIAKNPEVLVKHDLYMEAAAYTDTWVHLQTRATRNRIFFP